MAVSASRRTDLLSAFFAIPNASSKQDRALFFEEARAYAPLVGVTTNDGLRFIVGTKDIGVGRGLFLKRERKDMRALARALRILARHSVLPDGLFIDVGANLGTATVAALCRHGFESGVAIEPDPRNVMLLRVNLIINALEDRVAVIEAAASDRPGTLLLAPHAAGSGRSRIAGQGVPVEAIPLDALALDSPGMVWIDVEGYEPHVLAGARQLLAERPPIVLELQPRASVEGVFPELARDYAAVYDLRAGAETSFEELRARSLDAEYLRTTDVLLVPAPTRKRTDA